MRSCVRLYNADTLDTSVCWRDYPGPAELGARNCNSHHALTIHGFCITLAHACSPMSNISLVITCTWLSWTSLDPDSAAALGTINSAAHGHANMRISVTLDRELYCVPYQTSVTGSRHCTASLRHNGGMSYFRLSQIFGLNFAVVCVDTYGLQETFGTFRRPLEMEGGTEKSTEARGWR